MPSKACAINGVWHQGECGFLKQVKGESTSLLVQILFTAVAVDRAVTRVRRSGSIGASQAGQVYKSGVSFILYRQIESGFAPCLARRSGQSVGWQYDAGVGSGSPSAGRGSKFSRRQ